MILRTKFNKKNYLKYLSHLDLMRLFQRSFNRAEIPIKYSQGFNPHPKFSIANPLALGIESEEEYMDVELDYIPVEEFIHKMNGVLPKDIQIIKGEYLKKEESIDSLIAWAFYEIEFSIPNSIEETALEEMLKSWLNKDEILLTRIRKKGRKNVEKQVNIKNLIGNVVIKDINDKNISIDVLLKSGSNGNLKPTDFLDVLNRDNNLEIEQDTIEIKRISLFAEKDNNIYKPL